MLLLFRLGILICMWIKVKSYNCLLVVIICLKQLYIYQPKCHWSKSNDNTFDDKWICVVLEKLGSRLSLCSKSVREINKDWSWLLTKNTNIRNQISMRKKVIIVILFLRVRVMLCQCLVHLLCRASYPRVTCDIENGFFL